jgi:hypothetical protein
MSLWRTDDVTTPNTANSGPSWAAIKGPIGNSVRTHSITAIAIADGESDIVVVGHANGNVYRSTDATAASPQWQRIDTNGIGANRQCLALTIDPDDYDLIYAAFGGFQAGNLWRSNDGGQSWADIGQTLPEAPIRDISLHPQRSSWIYLATQVGLFASEDGGATWSPANEGPANVACRDLFWLGCRLVCVTHGRGIFEMDLSIANAFPAPVLQSTGTESYSVQGNAFTRYKLSVSNRASYPNSLFRPSPDLPPCGQNASAARTWVDIYDGDTDQRIYGFCALDSADDLDRLWFGLPQGDAPPGSVYVVLRDRRCPANYTSNPVSITAPAGAPGPTNPIPGATLTDDTVTFEWTAAGTQVSLWWLYVGSRRGGRDLYDSGSLGTNLFETVPGLPADGRQLFVRLWYRRHGTDGGGEIGVGGNRLALDRRRSGPRSQDARCQSLPLWRYRRPGHRRRCGRDACAPGAAARRRRRPGHQWPRQDRRHARRRAGSPEDRRPSRGPRAGKAHRSIGLPRGILRRRRRSALGLCPDPRPPRHRHRRQG